jgi:hypothetical protein
MRKALLIIVAVVVALSAIPITFACYNGGWGHWGWGYWFPHKPPTCCTTDCSVAFYSVQTGDNEGNCSRPQDIANTSACITDCYKKIVVTVNNAYPGYEGIVNFCVKNKGSLPATITAITFNNPNPGYLQLDLTGEVQEGVVIQPCNIICGHLLIYGIPQLPDAQNRTFTFTITINFECITGGCDTAYAYKCGYAKCFKNLGLGFSNWGWTNGPLGPGSYTFYLYAGVGSCNPTSDKKVGWLTVNYVNSRRNGATATITYHMYSGFTMTETHLYVGNEILPSKNGGYTVSPGQYPYSHTLNNASTDPYIVTGLSGNIYIIAHALVCP